MELASRGGHQARQFPPGPPRRDQGSGKGLPRVLLLLLIPLVVAFVILGVVLLRGGGDGGGSPELPPPVSCTLADGETGCAPNDGGQSLSCCTGLPLGGTGGMAGVLYVDSFVPYFNYNGSLRVNGSVRVASGNAADGLAQILDWDLGASADPACREPPPVGVANACGIHIHQGTDCGMDALGHYSKVTPDPWRSVSYTTGQGSRGVRVVTGLFLAQTQGRTLIVHDFTGARIACGIVAPRALFSTFFVKYPNYTGLLNVQGQVAVVNVNSSAGPTQVLQWVLRGMDTECKEVRVGVANSCGIHVHSGSDCTVDTLGHYFRGSSDPWKPISYLSSYLGDSFGTSPPVPTGYTVDTMLGRTIVVHNAAGARVACGILSPEVAVVSSFVPYYNYTGPLKVNGTVEVRSDGIGPGAYQTLWWRFTGGDPLCFGLAHEGGGNVCGIHIYQGTDCGSDALGNLYSKARSKDPWSYVGYQSGPDGLVNGGDEGVFTGLPGSAIIGRTVIVHDLKGAPIACGILEPAIKLDGSWRRFQGQGNTLV